MKTKTTVQFAKRYGIMIMMISLFFILLPVLADNPPDPGGEPEPGDPPVGGGTPIAVGIYLLMLLASVYGSMKAYQLFKKFKE